MTPNADALGELVEFALPVLGWRNPHQRTVALQVVGYDGHMPTHVAGMEGRQEVRVRKQARKTSVEKAADSAGEIAPSAFAPAK